MRGGGTRGAGSFALTVVGGVEAVHAGEELVEGLFRLGVAAAHAPEVCGLPCPAQSVQLVHENYRRRHLRGLVGGFGRDAAAGGAEGGVERDCANGASVGGHQNAPGDESWEKSG